jgi:hypothetical protein
MRLKETQERKSGKKERILAMTTANQDLTQLEERQRELLSAFQCVCETVDDCTCEKNLTPEALTVLRSQLAQVQQELERNQELTAQIVQQVEKETSIVEIDCEEFEYWSR